MIVNFVDSRINLPPSQPGSGTVNIRWQFGSQLSASLPPNTGVATIQLMRIIAPYRELARLTSLLNNALPSIRRYFAPSSWIEVYGTRASNASGEPLVGGAMIPTVGGLQSAVVGGAKTPTVGGLRSVVVGGAKTPTVGGPRSVVVGGASSNTNGGSLVTSTTPGGGGSNEIRGPLGGGADTIGRSLAPELSRAMIGAQCLYFRP